METWESRELEKIKRRERRNNKFKKRIKTRKIIQSWYTDEEWLDDNVVRLSDNLCDCSCDMCKSNRNNPLFKGENRLTLQERRFLDSIKDEDNAGIV